MVKRSQQNVFPTLRYKDTATALEWLQRAFGLQEKEVDRGEDGTIHHAELRFGKGLVLFGQYNDAGWMEGRPPDALASPMAIYIVVDDPDAHHARAKAAGARIVRDLVDQPYGSREYSARDLEGNLWSFGTYDPSASE